MGRYIYRARMPGVATPDASIRAACGCGGRMGDASALLPALLTSMRLPASTICATSRLLCANTSFRGFSPSSSFSAGHSVAGVSLLLLLLCTYGWAWLRVSGRCTKQTPLRSGMKDLEPSRAAAGLHTCHYALFCLCRCRRAFCGTLPRLAGAKGLALTRRDCHSAPCWRLPYSPPFLKTA